MLSKTSEYGIKAVIYVAHASQRNEKVGVNEVVEHIDAPKQFTAKILQQLVKNGLLNSTKGPNGGFNMTEEMRKSTNIKDIVVILDGDTLYEGCVLGLRHCGDANPCPVHEMYCPIKIAISDLHTKHSMEYLASKLNDIAVLK